MADTPLASFGLITDVQYANVDDAWNYHKTVRRYYRHTIQIQKWAVEEWIQEAKKPSSALCFAVDLGDLFDLKNAINHVSQEALEKTRSIYEPFQTAVGPVHHCVGNHEMYNLTRHEYIQELMMHTSSPHETSHRALPPSNASTAYYSFTLPRLPEYEFVVLDTYGFSVLGCPRDSTEYKEALEFLSSRNPNENKNLSDGLEGLDRRFVEYNGGIDKAQLAWLESLLMRVKAESRNVIVFMHVPVHENVTGGHLEALLWNSLEVRALFTRFSECVRVVFSGHTHLNAHAVCESGVHYVGLHAPLECDPNIPTADRAFALVDIFSKSVRIRGYGIIPQYNLTW